MIEALLTIAMTTAILLGSPGPAPIALAATGAAQGFKRGLPFLCGILTGLLIAVMFAAAGVATLLVEQPQISKMLKWAAAAYLVYVAYKIASNKSALDSTAQSLPRFKDGFLLNLLNPKAYAACIAIFASTTVPASSHFTATLLAASVCYSVAVLVDVCWLALGGVIFNTITSTKVLSAIRLAFALSLVALVVLGLLFS